jgi:hypothetical protein
MSSEKKKPLPPGIVPLEPPPPPPPPGSVPEDEPTTEPEPDDGPRAPVEARPSGRPSDPGHRYRDEAGNEFEVSHRVEPLEGGAANAIRTGPHACVTLAW